MFLTISMGASTLTVCSPSNQVERELCTVLAHAAGCGAVDLLWSDTALAVFPDTSARHIAFAVGACCASMSVACITYRSQACCGTWVLCVLRGCILSVSPWSCVLPVGELLQVYEGWRTSDVGL
jgi:hypothetical protein